MVVFVIANSVERNELLPVLEDDPLDRNAELFHLFEQRRMPRVGRIAVLIDQSQLEISQSEIVEVIPQPLWARVDYSGAASPASVAGRSITGCCEAATPTIGNFSAGGGGPGM